MRRNLYLLFLGIFIIILSACSSSSAANNGTNKSGDKKELTVAMNSEPDTLDWMSTGASPSRDVAWHIFEGLFGLDEDYKVKPAIAKSYEVSDDFLTYEIELREDVHFHNGKQVSVEDVIASIERWFIKSSVGQITEQYVESIEKTGDYSLEIKLNEVYNSFLSDLAAPKSALMVIPQEIAEEAGEELLNDDQLVGTGPYKFSEWTRGSHIKLEKFEEYSLQEGESSGLTGEKKAEFEVIKFQYVNDPQVIVNGIKTGLYDYGQGIPADLYDAISNNPNIKPVTYINGYTVATPNQVEAPFDDLQVRRALKLALDKEAIAAAAYGNEDFYELDGALFSPEQTELYSEEGTKDYLTFNQNEAIKLLEQSQYDGEEITIMFSNDNETYKRIAQVMKEQMEAVGFAVELTPYEWATYLDKWQDPKNWNIVVVGWSTRFSPNELGMLVQDTASSGWYKSEKWSEYLAAWGLAEDADERYEILSGMNETVEEEIPFIKIANETSLSIISDELTYESWVGPRLWNVTKAGFKE